MAARKRNVLIVEDEPWIALMLESELDSLGVHVVGPATNVQSALQLVETHNLDGALVDLNIGGTYTTAVADKLCAFEVPYIFVSGHAPPAGLRHRGVAILRKPFRQDELQKTVMELLEKASSAARYRNGSS